MQGTSRHSILTDHLGTSLELVDQCGQRTWQAQTTAYGRIRLDVGARCRFCFQVFENDR
ncbi:RHS domain-containing protein [Fibrella arboris]|uniref:RHS domain-containing protein n=1 Tax=Fibrella arboris TaxID=3242486 RepID=UPI00351FD73E